MTYFETEKNIVYKDIKLVATWYGHRFHGKLMSNGEIFDMNDKHTAASSVLPIGTELLLKNPENNKLLKVVIKDRMAKSSRVNQIDLSLAGAKYMGYRNKGKIVLFAKFLNSRKYSLF